MGQDRITSHRDASTYAQDYTSGQQKSDKSKQLPFSKDMIEAMENGDLEKAMKMLEEQKAKQSNNIVPEQLTKAIAALLAMIQKIFQTSSKSKKKAPEAHSENSKPFENPIKVFFSGLLGSSKGMIKEIMNKISRLFGEMQSKCSSLANSLTAPLRQLASRLNQTLLSPASKWLASKGELLKDQLNLALQVLKNQIDKVLNPVKEIINHTLENLTKAYSKVTDKLKDASDNLFTGLNEKYKDFKEKFKTLRESVSKSIEKIKDKTGEIGLAFISQIQALPEVVAAFAFWLVRQVAIPAGDLKRNIKKIVEVTKKAVSWMGEKARNAGHSAKKGAAAIGKGCTLLVNIIAENVIPVARKAIMWFVRLVLSLLELLWDAVVKLVNAVRRFVARVKLGLTRLWGQLMSMFRAAKQRFVNFANYLRELPIITYLKNRFKK